MAQVTKRIVYLPLEPYEERYTLQLLDWNVSRFKERGVPYKVIEGDALYQDKEIKTGQVLDAHGRCYYAMTQMANLVSEMAQGLIDEDDVIFSEDLFHPGYESLPYILNQMPKEKRPKVFTRNLAQSIDPDDFVFPWRNWMRDFENLVSKTVDGILMANTEMGPHMRIACLEAPLYVTGLPFDMNEVRSRVGNVTKPLQERQNRVVYCSRWDTEKQPWFFMDLIEYYSSKKAGPKITFEVLTGSKNLRSNDPKLVERALQMEERGLLKIRSSLSKSEYYEILSDSVLQFNCARQDWQSNTLNEASALGTPSLCPAFRSFPEALFNNERCLFVPWSLNDAWTKMVDLVKNPPSLDTILRPAMDQHKSIDRTIDILLGNGEQYRYAG